MTASTSRRGRKIRREGGHRTPACKACQQRKVKCSGGLCCTACLRKAAWDGVPPPEHCEYDGGYVPARKPTPPSTSPEGERIQDDDADHKGKGKASKPLQKGLACLACKARRVRCDGRKPSCSSCMRTAKRERREPCCVYRADLHVAQQNQRAIEEEERCSEETASPARQDEEPHTSAIPHASTSSSAASSSSTSSHAMSTSPPPSLPSFDLTKIPLPPLPNFAAPPPPHTIFPAFPAPSRTTSSSSSILSYSHQSYTPHSYPPSPSLTHASTDPSSSYPSPATPFSSVEDMLPQSCSDNLYNYPPLPYPPSAASMWAVPPLALGASVTQAPPPPPPRSHFNNYPTCESVEFQTATHDLDLTLTLPMSPPPTFTSTTSSLAPAPFLQTPVKVEPTETGGWWEEQVRQQLLNSVNQ